MITWKCTYRDVGRRWYEVTTPQGVVGVFVSARYTEASRTRLQQHGLTEEQIDDEIDLDVGRHDKWFVNDWYCMTLAEMIRRVNAMPPILTADPPEPEDAFDVGAP